MSVAFVPGINVAKDGILLSKGLAREVKSPLNATGYVSQLAIRRVCGLRPTLHTIVPCLFSNEHDNTRSILKRVELSCCGKQTCTYSAMVSLWVCTHIDVH